MNFSFLDILSLQHKETVSVISSDPPSMHRRQLPQKVIHLFLALKNGNINPEKNAVNFPGTYNLIKFTIKCAKIKCRNASIRFAQIK